MPILFAALLVLVAALAPRQPTFVRPTLLAPVAPPATWQPEHPLNRGLHLFPADQARAINYGPLAPYVVTKDLTLTFPISADLSRYDLPVGDQGYIGSCTSWAATYSLVGWWLDREGHGSLAPMAPMETYQQVNGGVDQGSWAYLNLDADEQGMVPLSLYPQGNYNWKTPATGTEEARGQHYRITGYLGIYNAPLQGIDPSTGEETKTPSHDELMTDVRVPLELALSHGSPVDLELAVYNNMYNATPQTAWVGPVDTATAIPLGGHDLIAVGYDNRGVWVENQWGTGWGLNGYAELSWDYVLDAVMDAYTIDGVTVPAHPYRSSVYHGTPTITTTFVNDGVPVASKTWKRGTEMVLTGRGFQPGETVSLSWDGTYRSYVTALPGGTWSIQWYFHPKDPTGPHNTHAALGPHTVKAVGSRGDYAWRGVLATR